MRTFILGGVFVVGFVALSWTGMRPEAEALGLNPHIGNLITIPLGVATTVLGSAAAMLHINTPDWFKAKTPTETKPDA